MVLPSNFLILASSVIAWFGVYLIITVTLNLEYGFTGIPNFGKLMVVAGGAFVAGSVPGRLVALIAGIDLSRDYINLNRIIISEVTQVLSENPLLSIAVFLVTLVVAGAVGAGLGFVSAYPVIRLREEFLAMTLLAVAEVFRVIGMNFKPIVGGPIGVSVPDPFRWVGSNIRFLVFPFIILAVALALFYYVHRMTQSPLGRVLRAVRDDEVAAETVGKDITSLRVKALVVSSAIGGVAGALISFYSLGIIAVQFERVAWTFWPWVMVLLGGMANNWGVMIGTGIFVSTRQAIFSYNDLLAPYLPFEVVWLDFLLLGVALLAILMVRPEGILPEKPIKTLPDEQIATGAIDEELSIGELGLGSSTDQAEIRDAGTRES